MYFRRSDRRAVLFVLIVILAIWGGVMIERHFLRPQSVASSFLDERVIDSLERPFQGTIGEGDSAIMVSMAAVTGDAEMAVGTSVETFPFDPNTADAETLRRLGLTEWQIKNIQKYRARGGRYHRPEDFKRLYGMTPEVYERLAPVIRIDKRFRYYDEADFAADDAQLEVQREAQKAYNAVLRAARQAHFDSIRAATCGAEMAYRDSLAALYPHRDKFKELVQIDLNTVDTTTLMRVPGIAAVRARQIIRYRERLGGFVSPDQLAEIEHFPAGELAEWFIASTENVRRLNVNQANVGQLARHPYIGYARAKAIETFRRNNGRIDNIDQLRLLKDFSEEDVRRLQPYLEY